MKKLLFFSRVCVLTLVIGSLVSCNKDDNGQNNGGTNNGNGGSGGGGGTLTGYVDLGLPSGTKWKDSNENGNGTGFYTFDEAVSAFGDKLPTKEQFEELKDNCTWEWQNNGGYKVTSSNGNSIVLLAAGCRDCSGDVNSVGSHGYYWSSTSYDSDYAWHLDFFSGYLSMYYCYPCNGLSVRLVQK